MPGIYHHHLASLIDRTLDQAVNYGMDPYFGSLAAKRLVLATALHESKGGYYLKQLGGGPALGIFQMEPLTMLDTIRYANEHVVQPVPRKTYGRMVEYIAGIDLLADTVTLELHLEGNLLFAILMCRLRYWLEEPPLPAANDIRGLAQYWKLHYNTPAGAGNVEDFITTFGFTVGLLT